MIVKRIVDLLNDLGFWMHFLRYSLAFETGHHFDFFFAVNFIVPVHLLQMVLNLILMHRLRVGWAIRWHVHKLFKTLLKAILRVFWVTFDPRQDMQRRWNRRWQPMRWTFFFWFLKPSFFLLDMCIDLLQIKLILVLINLQRLHNFSRHLLAVDGRELVEFLAHMVSVLPVFLIILSRFEFRELYHFRLIRHHVVLFALEKVGWHLHKNGYMDRSFHLMTRKGEDRFC